MSPLLEWLVMERLQLLVPESTQQPSLLSSPSLNADCGTTEEVEEAAPVKGDLAQVYMNSYLFYYPRCHPERV
jgi:hypothetical protein